MYGQDILCGISKVPFEIPHKITYPYIERYDFYTMLKFFLRALRIKSSYIFLKAVTTRDIYPITLLALYLLNYACDNPGFIPWTVVFGSDYR